MTARELVQAIKDLRNEIAKLKHRLDRMEERSVIEHGVGDPPQESQEEF